MMRKESRSGSRDQLTDKERMGRFHRISSFAYDSHRRQYEHVSVRKHPLQHPRSKDHRLQHDTSSRAQLSRQNAERTCDKMGRQTVSLSYL